MLIHFTFMMNQFLSIGVSILNSRFKFMCTNFILIRNYRMKNVLLKGCFQVKGNCNCEFKNFVAQFGNYKSCS